MLDKELVVMGHIKDAFGIQGWIKIHTDTVEPSSLLHYPVWYIGNFKQAWHPYQHISGQRHGLSLIAQVANVNSRDHALSLKGLLVAVARTQLPPTDNEEYYWADLIGLSVRNQHAEYLGMVVKLMHSPAHDLLVVEQDEKQRLIPFVSAIIKQVNVKDRTLQVEWEKDY